MTLGAAAASVKFALTDIAARFETETGHKIKLTFGSSGSITHQIEQGAPFEIFLAADESYIERLFERGFCRDRGQIYASGRLGLFVPYSAKFQADGELAGLRSALRNGQIKRFAIANPAHAPYGRAARAALESVGLWQEIKPLLALGENATQATQFAASGATQGGLIPLSLAQMPEIEARGQFALLPAGVHAGEPLRHRMVLLKNAGQAAADFYAYLQQPAARRILTQYGFSLPAEELP
jgi:molybdate transport system substrate-binding protein